MLKVPAKDQKEVLTFSEEISQELQKRDIQLVNLPKEEMIETRNDSIIDLAEDCIVSINLSRTIILTINHTRILKKMHSPHKLVGFCRNKKLKNFKRYFKRAQSAKKRSL